ncbi:flagellar hook-basal body complex protein FliE [Bradyrhizobium sp.]|uniref:flagellar hook-basal body complex protein FliE n=1 Tax=Bradyrhizobium sp. TaxID=376 RepID=UPI0025BE775D|nr:flagellar hook-basal body complex protein FliE [Bradyrhizobium sp.]MCA3569242.1 flagellar hook-basal body complex protein FliE [Bradyrhizobium sp.]
MSITAMDALSAYSRTIARQPPTRTETPAAENAPEGASFAAMVGGLVENAATATRTSEAVAQRAVTGRAELIDVVTSVSAAETSLETMVAVRDRMVSAYQDIMRMQI